MNRAGLGAINGMILFTRELGKMMHLLLIVMYYYFSTAPNTSPMNVRAKTNYYHSHDGFLATFDPR